MLLPLRLFCMRHILANKKPRFAYEANPGTPTQKLEYYVDASREHGAARSEGHGKTAFLEYLSSNDKIETVPKMHYAVSIWCLGIKHVHEHTEIDVRRERRNRKDYR